MQKEDYLQLPYRIEYRILQVRGREYDGVVASDYRLEAWLREIPEVRVEARNGGLARRWLLREFERYLDEALQSGKDIPIPND